MVRTDTNGRVDAVEVDAAGARSIGVLPDILRLCPGENEPERRCRAGVEQPAGLS